MSVIWCNDDKGSLYVLLFVGIKGKKINKHYVSLILYLLQFINIKIKIFLLFIGSVCLHFIANKNSFTITYSLYLEMNTSGKRQPLGEPDKPDRLLSIINLM